MKTKHEKTVEIVYESPDIPGDMEVVTVSGVSKCKVVGGVLLVYDMEGTRRLIMAPGVWRSVTVDGSFTDTQEVDDHKQ